jgi:RNA polymerase sigma factor (sigma-70 family)
LSVTMEPSTTRNTSLPISQKEVVSLAIEAHYSNLQTGIRVLVARSGLVDGETKIVETANEILQNTIEVALQAADRFDPTRSSYSWLMGIAVNKLREMRRDAKYETKRVQVFEDKDVDNDGPNERRELNDSEDSTAEERIDAVLYRTSNRSALEDQQQPLNEMLALVNESDRKILTLAIVDGLSGVDLAATLGIREGAAYVRLARAKEHLRKKYFATFGRKDS